MTGRAQVIGAKRRPWLRMTGPWKLLLQMVLRNFEGQVVLSKCCCADAPGASALGLRTRSRDQKSRLHDIAAKRKATNLHLRPRTPRSRLVTVNAIVTFQAVGTIDAIDANADA